MKILLFIALKVVEISVLVFLPYWVGKISMKKYCYSETKIGLWGAGLAALLLGTMGVISILILGYSFFQANWHLVNWILR